MHTPSEFEVEADLAKQVLQLSECGNLETFTKLLLRLWETDSDFRDICESLEKLPHLWDYLVREVTPPID